MPGYISEVDYDGGAGSNFVEIVVPATVDVSSYSLVVYDKDGTIVGTFGLGSPVTTFMGNNGYVIDGNTPDWLDLKNTDALALVDDTGTVLQFIAFKEPVTAVEGPANGTSATQVGEHSGSKKSLVSTDGGNSYSPTETSSSGTIPCFAPGTLIDTPTGPRAVETLERGDAVCSPDGPAETIVWIQHREVTLDPRNPDDLPVLIKAGALGPGRPVRNLVVSGQHRVLLGPTTPAIAGFDADVLVPAKALTDLPGIRLMRGRRSIIWHHFAFAEHRIVMAEGLPTESLLLGDMVLAGLRARDRVHLSRVGFRWKPGIPLNGPPARPLLGVGQFRRRYAQVRAGAEPVTPG